MKLKDMYIICKNNYEIMSSCRLIINEELCECYLDDEKRIEKILDEELSSIEYLQSSVSNFKKEVAYLDGFKPRTEPQTDKYAKAKGELIKKMKSIIDIYESLGLDGKVEAGLDIKLPTTKDFQDFRKIIDDLDFIFTKCPFFKSETEELRFNGLDVGSEWLNFVVVGVFGASSALVLGSVLLNNIAAFIDKCIAIKNHKAIVRQQEELVESSIAEQKEKEELIKNLRRIIEIQIENLIKEMEEISGYKIMDGDDKGRVVQSLEKLEKLIDKGLQIYSAIGSPPEVKKLFEPLEIKYLSIQNELKALEKKSD